MKPAILGFLILAASFSAGSAAQLPSVESVKSRDTSGCNDGIGRTFELSEFDEADAAGALVEFLTNHAACTSIGLLGRSLLASCSQGVGVALEGRLGIYCSVTVLNIAGSSPLTIERNQFALISASGEHLPNAHLLSNDSLQNNLAQDAITVDPGEVGNGYIAFAVPSEETREDLVLVWEMPSAASGSEDRERSLQIIVQDRERMLNGFAGESAYVTRVDRRDDARSASAAENSNSDASLRPEVAESLSGRSDTVSDPVLLPPGRYIVDGSFTGIGNFIVWVHHSNGESDLLFNELDSYIGQATFVVDGQTSVIFEVTGEGVWAIEVRPAF